MPAPGAAVDATGNDFATITPSDTVTYDGLRSIYVGGTGDVYLQNKAGVSVPFQSVPAGTFINVKAQRVMAATTATKLVGIF
jgi:hypothetical protein